MHMSYMQMRLRARNDTPLSESLPTRANNASVCLLRQATSIHQAFAVLALLARLGRTLSARTFASCFLASVPFRASNRLPHVPHQQFPALEMRPGEHTLPTNLRDPLH